jgi:hypothetical protein
MLGARNVIVHTAMSKSTPPNRFARLASGISLKNIDYHDQNPKGKTVEINFHFKKE